MYSCLSNSQIETAKKYNTPGFCLDSFFVIDINGGVIAFNYAAERITDILTGDPDGSMFANLFTDPEKADDMLRLVLAEGVICDFPLSFISGPGRKESDVLFNAFSDTDKNLAEKKCLLLETL